MFWQDDEDEKPNYDSGDIVDLIFRLQGKTLPVDHLHLLYEAIRSVASWIEEEQQTGIQLLLSAEEGNGWAREDNPDEILYLSRRTRLLLRVQKHQLEEAETLQGKTLDLQGHQLAVKSSERHPLSPLTTLYARHVALDAEEESEFLKQVLDELNALDIHCKKILCGKSRQIKTTDKTLRTRSLMLADLSQEDAIKLQQKGLGPHRYLSCGLFIPHKSIK